MIEKNTGGPAFPYQETVPDGLVNLTPQRGMTLRDYFAAKAMQATVIAWIQQSIYPSTDFEVAQNAYAVADAMLQAREQ